MKRSRFTEEQIIAVLREQEAGVATAEVCRKHGISSATFYAWKAKFGGMDVSVNRLPTLTPPFEDQLMAYDADRRRDPTPNSTRKPRLKALPCSTDSSRPGKLVE